MLVSVHLYAWQAVIVGNARLGGRDLRAAVLDDPWVGVTKREGDVFRGFACDGDFEPSFYAWLDLQRVRGLQAIRTLCTVDPGDWALHTPPPRQPPLPEFALVFPDRLAWYRYKHSSLDPRGLSGPYEECFVEVPEESRPATITPLEEAERELLVATRDYVAFVEARARADDATDMFYAKQGRTTLELLEDTEDSFRERLIALRQEELKEYRRRAKQWHPVQPATRAMRPVILENAARWLVRDDYLSVLEAAGASWRAVRLARASQDAWPLNMDVDRRSQEDLPPFIHAPGYVAIGRRWACAAAAALNAALNMR
ncbi:hypothetical protein [Myxococcus sp. CA039A]|uniref:hypothetical protein n=1 Tax=Myxococcus sp. CA039A TaxID=2741737 RepID=UPI00157A2825|nr:hypothetical protein [Myxococcus sp. CA039A]NTX51324.1 hypothetical protein [Myxococcus sp. CA039A]